MSYPSQPSPGHQQPQQPGAQWSPQQHGKVVTKKKMTQSALIVHIVLTCLTFWACGGWGWVWFIHWLMTREKTVTRY